MLASRGAVFCWCGATLCSERGALAVNYFEKSLCLIPTMKPLSCEPARFVGAVFFLCARAVPIQARLYKFSVGVRRVRKDFGDACKTLFRAWVPTYM